MPGALKIRDEPMPHAAGIVCQLDGALAMPSIDGCGHFSPAPFPGYNFKSFQRRALRRE
jgi:hypothetical protein